MALAILFYLFIYFQYFIFKGKTAKSCTPDYCTVLCCVGKATHTFQHETRLQLLMAVYYVCALIKQKYH